ncbi:nucleotide-binding domain containing protein [Microvirga tunisiensis]|uniref:nucleotide-binding domain containing protein n=1 Tax=Microvirga tunisiensis TaxID=2108360 RepID=UPI0013869E8E
MTGGETARAILDRAGISGLRMQGEIEPGAPVGISIGDRTTLRRCRAILRGGPGNHSNSTMSG